MAKSCDLTVRALSLRSTQGVVLLGPLRFPCALGRAGRSASKREGDGATPWGRWVLRRTLYRQDRVARPRAPVPVAAIRPNDGWCDSVGDRNYNRFIRHPYPASAERLWREDRLYDVVVVLGHNDIPRVQGMGSAIFLHVAGPGLTPTEGCIALERRHLVRLLACMRRGGVAVRTAH